MFHLSVWSFFSPSIQHCRLSDVYVYLSIGTAVLDMGFLSCYISWGFCVSVCGFKKGRADKISASQPAAAVFFIAFPPLFPPCACLMASGTADPTKKVSPEDFELLSVLGTGGEPDVAI